MLCRVATIPAKLGIPMIMLVTKSSVTLSYKPPANADDSKAMKYVTKYRKDGDSEWESMPETSELTETVTGLDENTIYEFAVAVNYEDGTSGPQSDVVRVKTKKTVASKF